MVREFNCNKIKRTFWPFTMKDIVDENGKVKEKGQKLVVRMPQKKVFEAIKEMEIGPEDEPTAQDSDAVYSLLAAVLSNNMNKRIVRVEDLEDYDIEECTEILNAYMVFVDELKTDPN